MGLDLHQGMGQSLLFLIALISALRYPSLRFAALHDGRVIGIRNDRPFGLQAMGIANHAK